MLQWIITVCILALAAGFGVYRTVKYFSNPIRGCDGCDKNCGGCSLEELKKEIELKKAKSSQR
ncbi:MAG: hypothetical protein NTU98_14170 [Bacteroidetes bacterium]|nr:hypothetical protein [Bacteroidota bacterium]